MEKKIPFPSVLKSLLAFVNVWISFPYQNTPQVLLRC